MPTQMLLDLRKLFKVDEKDSEVTIELDPGTFDAQKLRTLSQKGGFTRFSMGVQTLNEKEFDTLGRGHRFAQIGESIKILQNELDRDQVSTDLMIGLPHQSLESFKESLEKMEEFGFGHISLYIL